MKLRRTVWVLLLLSTIVITILVVLSTGEGDPMPEIHSYPHKVLEEPLSTLRVMTLNIAHGRKKGPHQLFQTSSSIKRNLRGIAAVIQRENVHIAALQEADRPSFWSGGFDHVAFLANEVGFAFAAHGKHVNLKWHAYGTAILSRLPFINPLSVKLPSSWIVPSKGIVRCGVCGLKGLDSQVDIYSIHLDPTHPAVRRKQVDILIETIRESHHPVIIMGDFNCSGKKISSALKRLISGLQLQAHQPDNRELITYPRFRRRLDWILISPTLRFIDYHVLPDILSDHLGVVAEIGVCKD
ncbi:MAG: endonuclease/exonuclease/phosphatase family protein [Candidatus Cloacimonetes bacterium]|nr:endonuclease/exonuclease/phosphatase family protein [Candidatus Cloacimonadota bacterium]